MDVRGFDVFVMAIVCGSFEWEFIHCRESLAVPWVVEWSGVMYYELISGALIV